MASSYQSSPETTNANRACRVVLGPCTDGLRDILRHYVPPPTFPNVIKIKKLNLPRLTAVQRDLILPSHGSYSGNYDDMDISLLYILLRNVASGISPHNNGWGNDPDPNDKSLSANIERIRIVRNRCVHSSDPFMSNSDFKSIWSTIRSAIVDLDSFLINGNKYENAVDFLRHESMDPEHDLHYEQELRKQVEEDKTTRKMVVSLKRRVDENAEETNKFYGKVAKLTKSPIPPNVREQYDNGIQKWKEEDKFYYETHSFPSVMQKIRNQPYVTLVGMPGSGKSATARHIALKLQEEGYEIVPTKDVRKMEDYGDPRNPQVFVIDDVVGLFGLQITKLDVLIDYQQKIVSPCMAKSKTLMTCREVVFKETLPIKRFFTKEDTVIKLHSFDNALNAKDKMQILQKYGLSTELISPSLLSSTSHMFPLLCKLFSKESNFQALGPKFFLTPVQCTIDQLNDIQMFSKLNYATLVLCMLNKNSLSKGILKDRQNEHFLNIKSDTLENCRLENNTDTFKFMDALSAMEGTYTKQCGAKYTFIHDSMFEICAYQYGTQYSDQMLPCMNSSYIANFVKPHTWKSDSVNKVNDRQNDFQSVEGVDNSNNSDEKENESGDENNGREKFFDLCIRLREDQYPLFADILYRDVQDMELYDVFRNEVLKHPQVCQAFIDLIETKSYTELKSLFLSSQEKVDKIVSKQKCVLKESGDRGEWVRQQALVDQRYKQDKEHILYDEFAYNVRVVNWVAYYGHFRIMQCIIQQTQQHNEINELFGITENAPDKPTCTSGIDTCDKEGNENNNLFEHYRLLVFSCYSGDVQTVRVLLHICKETINGIKENIRRERSRFWSRYSPLAAACEGGHVSVVKELINAGASINLQDVHGDLPLIAACRGGHIDVVDELVKAGADINVQSSIGDTPLITACEGGHVSVVKGLLKARADMGPENDNGYTPLIAACNGGYVSVVEELVKAGADINQQNIWKHTPLVAAVRNGSVSTVKCLVEHGADLVNQVVDTTVSAVYTAIIVKKPNILKYLIREQNKIIPGECSGNVHLFNCLVDIRHAGVKIDNKDDVVVTDKSMWCIEKWDTLWETIIEGHFDDLSHLLSVGLDANQWIQDYSATLLLYKLIDDLYDVRYRTERVRLLLGAGADVNAKVRYREYGSVLDREGVSVLERTKRLMSKYSGSENYKYRVPEYKKVMREIKKHVRRHSI